MMVLVALEELIDVNPWHGLRFGNLNPVADAGIERYYVAGSLYDVALSLKQLEVRKDARFLFATDSPAEVRQVNFENGQIRFQLRTTRPPRPREGKRLFRYCPAPHSTAHLPL